HRPDGEPADDPGPGAERRLGVEAHELVVASADLLRGPPERGDRPGGLGLRPLERLAALAGDALRELLDPLRDAAGDVIERVRPSVDWEMLAFFERLGGDGDGLLDVALARNADLLDHAPVVGA